MEGSGKSSQEKLASWKLCCGSFYGLFTYECAVTGSTSSTGPWEQLFIAHLRFPMVGELVTIPSEPSESSLRCLKSIGGVTVPAGTVVNIDILAWSRLDELSCGCRTQFGHRPEQHLFAL